MPGRKFSSLNYRYGFNGKENDNDVKGQGNQQDYGMRIYDPRLGKFLSVDPLTKAYPTLTPYQFASNSVIAGVDLDGMEFLPINSSMYRMMTTKHTVLVLPVKETVEYRIVEMSNVANVYKNIPEALQDGNGGFKYVQGGVIGTNGRDWNSEIDGGIITDPNKYHVKSVFYGTAQEGRSFQDITSLKSNVIPGKSTGNNGGVLGESGLGGIVKNYLNQDDFEALGDE